MNAEITAESYFEEGVGPLSGIIGDSKLGLQWGPSDEMNLENRKTSIECSPRVLENRTIFVGFCISIAAMMMLFAIEHNQNLTSSAITVAASVLSILVGFYFGSSKTIYDYAPEVEYTGHGLRFDDYLQHRISYAEGVKHRDELLKAYVRKSRKTTFFQLCLIGLGMASVISSMMVRSEWTSRHRHPHERLRNA